MKRTTIILIIITLVPSFCIAQKDKSLAFTPSMGWSSWNKFDCHINEQLINGIADHLVSLGLRDDGYEYQDALTYAKWGIDFLKYD